MPLYRLIDQSLTTVSSQNLSLILIGESSWHAIFGGNTLPEKVYSCAPDSAIRFVHKKT